MNRRFLFFGIAGIAVLAFVAVAIWGGGGWGDHTQVTRIVPGQNGETTIITEGDGHRGFFPFFPFFFFIPLLWFLVIGGLFSAFGRRRWGGPGFGPRPETREAWLADWHQRQHQPSGNVMPTSTPTPPDAAATGGETPETEH
jgi:hypothetical protein